MGSLHLVGGEKGGVGKSVVSRLLCQLFIDQQRGFVGFDGDASHPALLRYYAGYAQPVDLHGFEGCDTMLMAAIHGAPVVVDMPAQSARSVSRWIRESGVAEVAAEGGVRVVRWHVMDDGKDSLKLLQALVDDRVDGVDLVVVRNFGRGSDFSWMATTPEFAAASEAGAIFIDLPGLHAPTMSKIDRMDASFWAASQNRDESKGPNLNLLESRRVRVWLESAHAALVAAHPSLRPVATNAQPVQPVSGDESPTGDLPNSQMQTTGPQVTN